jgi:hypothetical protein
MKLNFIAIGVATLIPNIFGMIWYNKNLFGKIWQAETGQSMEPEAMKGKIAKIMVVSLIMSFLIAMALNPMVIHQMGITSLLAGDPANMEAIKAGAKIDVSLNDKSMNVMENFRTFKHGAFHGVLYGLFLILPIVSIGAMYENRSWKYSLITAGYWIINMALMGGIICAWK